MDGLMSASKTAEEKHIVQNTIDVQNFRFLLFSVYCVMCVNLCMMTD